MSASEIHAHYLPSLGAAALCLDANTHTLTIERAEALLLELQMAVLQARIAAKRAAMRPCPLSPDMELAELERSFDAQFAAVFSPSDPSPASEVTP